MNKKLLIFSLIILISISFAYALTFNDIASGRVSLVDLILGRVTYNTTTQCTDSDNGLNYYTKGQVDISGGIAPDQCLNSNTLQEAYCYNSNSLSIVSYVCPNGCSNGACVDQTTKVCIESWSCTDWSYCKNYQQTRTCTDANNCGTIANKPAITQSCASAQLCTDSDNGRDYNSRGNIYGFCYDCSTQGIGSNSDSCKDTNTLMEFYCINSTGWIREIINCPFGCSNGACISETVLAKPDLTVLDIKINSTSPKINEYITITTTVKNIGNSATSTLGILTESNPLPDYIKIYAHRGTLLPGESIESKIIVRYNTTGSYQIKSTADAFNSINESNESNNELTKTITISGGTAVSTCTDSDGGLNYVTKGVVTKGAESKQDSCQMWKSVNDAKEYLYLVEYTCINNSISFSFYKCSQCSSGICPSITVPATPTSNIGIVTSTGANTVLAINTVATFSINVSTGKSEPHSAKVTSIGTNKATIVISSTPQTITLSIGETKNIDLDADNKADLEIRLNRITTDNKADITFKKIMLSTSPIIQASAISTQCQGEIINNLCYMDTANQPIESYEDENVKIWAEYPKNNPPETRFTFNLIIKNKLNNQITLDYQYNVRPDVYNKISTDILTNDNAPKKGLHLTLQPLEEKRTTTVFEVLNTNIFAPFLIIHFWIGNQALEGLVFQDITCEGRNYESFEWDNGEVTRCCNNVIYPSMECCSDDNCPIIPGGSYRKKCIDGQCMGPDRMFPFHSNNPEEWALAIGNKNVLYISASQSYISNKACVFEQNIMNIPLFNTIESFYDNQAAELLNKDSNFINFNWNLIKIRPDDLGIRSIQNREEIINAILLYCDLNLDNYDLVILEADTVYTNGWCPGGPGCAIRNSKNIYLTSPYITLENPSIGNTVTHEVNHFFGALDQYTLAGSRYQWDGCLQCPQSRVRTSNPHLQVIRAEIGWDDLNQNEIVDVIERKETAQTCLLDETPYNQCSSTKPLYCDNGNLINKCDICGCPSGLTCNIEGNCKPLTDENAPIIENTLINPSLGSVGTIFTITTKVSDEQSGVDLVKAYVKKEVIACSDECYETRQCFGNGYQTCGNYDADSCLEWSTVTACPSGQTCSNGQCIITCTPQTCSGLGMQCGNWDDGCGGTLNCGTCLSDQTCQTDGSCRAKTKPSITVSPETINSGGRVTVNVIASDCYLQESVDFWHCSEVGICSTPTEYAYLNCDKVTKFGGTYCDKGTWSATSPSLSWTPQLGAAKTICYYDDGSYERLEDYFNVATTSQLTCTPDSIIGDADGNGRITPEDARLIYNLGLGRELMPSNKCCIDVDNDGDVDQDDSTMAFNYFLIKTPSGNAGKKCSEITTSSSITGKVTQNLGEISKIIVAEITLYDDGAHGDGVANDGVYGNVWDSTGQSEETYYVDIYAEDNAGNSITADNAVTFSLLSTNLCVPVIENGEHSKKIDVIFIPNGFMQEELPRFASEIVPKSIGSAENSKGILSFEPFSSNKERFNFYYVNKASTFCTIENRYNECIANGKELASICPFYDEIIIVSKIPLGAWAQPHFVMTHKSIDESIYGEEAVTVHEFGHSFAGLGDEYVITRRYDPLVEDSPSSPNCDVFGCQRWCSSQPTLPKPQVDECMAITYESKCLNVERECFENPTSGCFVGGVCDKTRYPNACACVEKCNNAQYTPKCYFDYYTTNTPVCTSILSTENFGINCIQDAGCYQGCFSQRYYRSSQYSIMGSADATNIAALFNAVSKRQINKILACCYPTSNEEYISADCVNWKSEDNIWGSNICQTQEISNEYLFTSEDLAEAGYDITNLEQRVTPAKTPNHEFDAYITEIEPLVQISVVSGEGVTEYYDASLSLFQLMGMETVITNEYGDRSVRGKIRVTDEGGNEVEVKALLIQKSDTTMIFMYLLADEDKINQLVTFGLRRI